MGLTVFLFYSQMPYVNVFFFCLFLITGSPMESQLLQDSPTSEPQA